jgi:hypothetical protein
MRKEGLTEDGIDATIVFWVVRDLCVLAKYYLAARSHHSKL